MRTLRQPFPKTILQLSFRLWRSCVLDVVISLLWWLLISFARDVFYHRFSRDRPSSRGRKPALNFFQRLTQLDLFVRHDNDWKWGKSRQLIFPRSDNLLSTFGHLLCYVHGVILILMEWSLLALTFNSWCYVVVDSAKDIEWHWLFFL